MSKFVRSEPSQRQLRVGEEIRHGLAETLIRGRFRDPDLQNAHLVTVSAVSVSPDLKNATAFVMPLGGIGADIILPALNRAAPYFRSELGRRGNFRHVPRLTFELDISFDTAHNINTLLRDERVARDIEKPEDDNIAEKGSG